MSQLGVFHYVPIAVDRQHRPVPRLVVKDQPAERSTVRLVWVTLHGGRPGLLRRQPAVMLHYPCVATPLGLQAVEILSFVPCHGSTVDRSSKGRLSLKQDHFSEQVESGSPVELPFDLLDAAHGGERDAEATSEDLAEVADVPGGRVQPGAAGQDILEIGAMLRALRVVG
ncbi:hypothetical protein [Streptomyces sp. CBMA152]|uniref:hypothetical protein n=1 Tax=Streptomyces sp. CBMA152 TaxID=1896312 RepID=UPI001660DC8F|nr:hypothetical protein [Streptomyces sp. CBMA152]MBD0742265.1 hypothetical protein [Streptomyces sp. CBMA152]